MIVVDKLNSILYDFCSKIDFSDFSIFNNYVCLTNIILNNKCPKFKGEIFKFKLNSSISVVQSFLDNFDDDYGLYFYNRLNDNTFEFSKVKRNSDEKPSSYYDVDKHKKTIYIPFENSIIDSFSIVHEVLHDMNLDVCKRSICRELFSEFISLFGETLLEDYMEKNYGFSNLDNFNYNVECCYYLALDVRFQLELLNYYVNEGNIDEHVLNYIINDFGNYKDYVESCYEYIIDNNYLDMNKSFRYLSGILLTSYTYLLYQEGKITKNNIKSINDNMCYLDPSDIYSILGLKLYDYKTMVLSAESYNKISESYTKVLKVM